MALGTQKNNFRIVSQQEESHSGTEGSRNCFIFAGSSAACFLWVLPVSLVHSEESCSNDGN